LILGICGELATPGKNVSAKIVLSLEERRKKILVSLDAQYISSRRHAYRFTLLASGTYLCKDIHSNATCFLSIIFAEGEYILLQVKASPVPLDLSPVKFRSGRNHKDQYLILIQTLYDFRTTRTTGRMRCFHCHL
jgi:hypothetical protein